LRKMFLKISFAYFICSHTFFLELAAWMEKVTSEYALTAERFHPW